MSEQLDKWIERALAAEARLATIELKAEAPLTPTGEVASRQYWRERAEAAEARVREVEEALRVVIAVADRKTVEFNRARAALGAQPSPEPTP